MSYLWRTFDFIAPYNDLLHGVRNQFKVLKIPTECDELAEASSKQKQAEATNRQCHEDQEYSSPPAHRKCNDPGICVTLYLCLCSFLQ